VNDGIAIEMRDVVKRFGEVSAVDGSRATVVAPDGLALCGQSYQPLRLDEPAFISIELAARLGDGAGVHDRADRRRDPVFQKHRRAEPGVVRRHRRLTRKRESRTLETMFIKLKEFYQ